MFWFKLIHGIFLLGAVYFLASGAAIMLASFVKLLRRDETTVGDFTTASSNIAIGAMLLYFFR